MSLIRKKESIIMQLQFGHIVQTKPACKWYLYYCKTFSSGCV